MLKRNPALCAQLHHPEAGGASRRPAWASASSAVALGCLLVAAACGPAPTVLSVSVPPDAAGVVPLKVTVADPGGGAVSVRIRASLDGGLSWRPGHYGTAPTGLVAAPSGTEHIVEWDSIKDVGFHTPAAVRLEVVAEGSSGVSAPLQVSTGIIDNLRARARRIQSYVVNYGDWNDSAIAFAKQHDLVIVHPTASQLTREFIADLQHGQDAADPADDVLVLCYVSVGEDGRLFNLTDAQARSDPRFRGDGTGPRVDPRGPNADGQPLTNIPLLGSPSSGGTGWASYYLDDNSVFLSASGKGDGIPDRNSIFGGYFVNAGDPKWFDVIDADRFEQDGIYGLREVLTASWGRSLDCDGVFLDTIDTAAPNNFTSAASLNLSKFEWTAPGMSLFIKHLHEVYPHRLLLQNRGLFYFDPRKPQFQFSTSGNIDFFFFESYRLDSNQIDPDIYPENRWQVAPKLMAEANRPNGFVVLSLGYAEGTQQAGAVDTLRGQGTVAIGSLLEDIHVTQELAGFRHYLTNGEVDLVNSFVRDHSNWQDHTPPQWTSTWNIHDWPEIVKEATPRVGIQDVVPAAKALVVRWDVALDQNRVGYALYYQRDPFDFVADPKLTKATRVVLRPSMPATYKEGTGPNAYPYEQTIGNLEPGATYYLLIRTFDDSAAHNEDENQQVIIGVPLP
jgi:hypothetical protein